MHVIMHVPTHTVHTQMHSQMQHDCFTAVWSDVYIIIAVYFL